MPAWSNASGDSGLTSGEVPEATQVDVSHIRRKWLDVAYAGISPAQRLDVYAPDENTGLSPVVLFIHGGAFALGDKRDEQVLPFLRGLDRSYAVVSANYRLSREAVFPAALEDVKGAIRWLKAHGGEYGLDTGRIAVCGQSAGANLAAMVCVTTGLGMFDNPALGNTAHSSDVHAAVDLFGPTEFLSMDEQLAASGLGPCYHHQADSPESAYLGAKIAQVPTKVLEASPITYIHEGMPPILIQHGRLDCVVPYQQSVGFAKAIALRVGPEAFELDVFDHAAHDDLLFASDENMARVFGFLDRRLK